MAGDSGSTDAVVGAINARRRDIKALAQAVRSLKADVTLAGGQVVEGTGKPRVADTLECLVNVTLAYRHLEDASMRLGKAIQAADGGVSVYDRDTTVGA